MVLEAIAISKSYGNGTRVLPVLTDLNISVAKGEMVTIMGPSGSGKSTLLNILGTLDEADSGEVFIHGRSVTKLSDEQLANLRNQHIGFVFQFHHLLPEFTAIENVLIPAMIQGQVKDQQVRAGELFSYMGLSDRQDHYPSQLSGGERLRVAVLRALINKPDLVLADEPTGNLDIDNAKRLLRLFSKIREDFNQAFVITTHNPEVAQIGDRKYFLQNGALKPLDKL